MPYKRGVYASWREALCVVSRVAKVKTSDLASRGLVATATRTAKRSPDLKVLVCRRCPFEDKVGDLRHHDPVEEATAMNKSTSLRRILLAPPSLRSSIFTLRASHPTVVNPRGYATVSVTQPSFWKGMIPKPFRRDSASRSATKKPRSKEWNPATFFIFIFLLIGSMSIQMIALRNEFAAFSRRADAKIGLLKEVIERIQKGEDVDVEGLLGTGDAKREREWEEGISVPNLTLESVNLTYSPQSCKRLNEKTRLGTNHKKQNRSLART
jgi:hypothetical protein